MVSLTAKCHGKNGGLCLLMSMSKILRSEHGMFKAFMILLHHVERYPCINVAENVKKRVILFLVCVSFTIKHH